MKAQMFCSWPKNIGMEIGLIFVDWVLYDHKKQNLSSHPEIVQIRTQEVTKTRRDTVEILKRQYLKLLFYNIFDNFIHT